MGASPTLRAGPATATAFTHDCGVSNSIVTVERVLGDGPFAEVGRPVAMDSTVELVVIGGDLGWPQWNGRSVLDRSDRSVGWYPIGVYDAADLRCLRLLTSSWEVNTVAIHPAGRLIAIGTGAYDGGYAFEGELLIHDLDRGTTTSMLNTLRMIASLEWLDAETLSAVVAPATDEELNDWPLIEYEGYELRHPDWARLDRRSVDLNVEHRTRVEWVQSDPAVLKDSCIRLSTRLGAAWQSRRQAWALAADGDGVLVGLERAVERWDDEGNLVWRTALNGTCTQLQVGPDGSVVAAVWGQPGSAEPLDRPTTVVALDARSGAILDQAAVGYPAILVNRESGDMLIRDTRHGPAAAHPGAIWSSSFRQEGELGLSAYDLFNHYFDIRRATQFLILVGDDPRSWESKHVAEVRRTPTGSWTVERLFPLARRSGDHLYGGPGVFVHDPAGEAIVHTGIVHDGRGLLPGNAFIARRRYPDGQLIWHVPLDNQITALDESDGRIIAVTNLGELVVVNASDGSVLARADRLSVDENPIVPLSVAIDGTDGLWLGALDGRVLQIHLRWS